LPFGGVQVKLAIMHSSPQSSFVPLPKYEMPGKEGRNLCSSLNTEKQKKYLTVHLTSRLKIFSVIWARVHQTNLICALRREFYCALD